MKIYSWNVNGFRAVAKKGFWDWFNRAEGDVVCVQETKASPEQLLDNNKDAAGYESIWNPATVKKGYSGVAAWYRTRPLDIQLELPGEYFQGEGRLIQLEFKDFYLLNVYFPNGKKDSDRLQYKLDYYDEFLEHVEGLRRNKPIVLCGDLNTAHKEIDLKNPQANKDTSGFLPIEREWMDRLIEHGYIDTFRMFNQEPGNYTWWSYRSNARSRNAGWRLDYFFVSEELRERVLDSWIESGVLGSDHCPVGIEISD
ncbi:MAG: exodeoxyribonuclease III [Thermodesulfobacteriota bacterium]